MKASGIWGGGVFQDGLSNIKKLTKPQNKSQYFVNNKPLLAAHEQASGFAGGN